MRVRKIFQEWSATETADGDYQRNQILAINTEKLYPREEVLKGRDAGLVHGERGRTRTCDPCLKRALLYQLSYAPTIFLM